MKNILKLEELLIAIAAIYAISILPIHLPWWLYIILFFAPDISILGYVAGNKAGAACYNLFHHKGIATIVAAVGLFTGNYYIVLAGLMLLAHSSFDRILGYGLKYVTGFKHTHLGEIG